MNAIDRAFAKAIHAWDAARPQSGYRPETEAEWIRLVAANEKMAIAMYMKLGNSKAKARELSRKTHGGEAGRLLLEISLRDDGGRHG